MVEIYIQQMQARILAWVGLAWLLVGLGLGYDPLAVAWRAAAGALLAMLLGGVLLRAAARSMLSAVVQSEAVASSQEPR